MLVSAPATSANCGPGFDVLGIAFSKYFYLSTEPIDGFTKITPKDRRFEFNAYTNNGGKLEILYYKTEIDSGGKGLGSSSAAICVGAFLALREQGLSVETAKQQTYEYGFSIEKHGDNIGPAVFGAGVVASNNFVEKVNLTKLENIHLWISDDTSMTNENRGQLSTTVDIQDAVFNISHACRLVLALERGELHKLKEATKDKLHQDQRLEKLPTSKKMLELAYETNAYAAWLSGSGPSILAIFPEDETAPEGFEKIPVDQNGVTEINA